MTGTVSDETDDEGTGVHGMKQSHEFRTRKASNPNDWLRTRLVAPEFHCVCLDESRRNGCGRQVGFDDPVCPRDVIGLLSDWRDELKRGFSVVPGYVKDHIVPLVCGGRDAVSNMQWQTIHEARAQDKWETKGCGR